MIRVFALIAIAVFSVLLTLPAQAQRVDLKDQSHRANPRYDFMVQQAMRHQNPNFDFGRMRSFYMQTRQYDPIGDETAQELDRLAYSIQTGTGPDNAIVGYRALVKDHLANLRIVLLALSYAREDPRFGNPAFFEWARDGLLRNLLRSGNGRSLDDAYDVIALAEETALFAQLGLAHLGTDARREGYYYYNMHRVRDRANGRTWTLFINTTRPMRFLKRQQDLRAVQAR